MDTVLQQSLLVFCEKPKIPEGLTSAESIIFLADARALQRSQLLECLEASGLHVDVRGNGRAFEIIGSTDALDHFCNKPPEFVTNIDGEDVLNS